MFFSFILSIFHDGICTQKMDQRTTPSGLMGGIMGGQKVVGQWKGGWAGSKFCLKNDSFFFTFLPCVQVQNFHFPSTLCVIVDVCMQCTILCSGIYHFTLRHYVTIKNHQNSFLVMKKKPKIQYNNKKEMYCILCIFFLSLTDWLYYCMYVLCIQVCILAAA